MRQTCSPSDSGAWSVPGLAQLHSEMAGGDPRIRIAVLDGPVDLAHPCFAGSDIEALPTVAPPVAPGSDHGTHVASVIFGQPESAVHGLAHRCRGMVLPVYSQADDRSLIPCRQMDLGRAINQAVAEGAHVINISGGELSRGGEADHYLSEAVRRCAESNVLLVSAAGNHGCECLQVPAALPSVLAVGALDAGGRPMPFSNWGGPLGRQGIMAPGEEILGAVPGGGTLTWSGTSFAAPIVSGAAALLLALQLAAGRRPDPGEVYRALLAGATPCDPRQLPDCRRLLAGTLNVHKARELLGLGARRATPTADSINRKESKMDQETMQPGVIAQAADAGAPPAEMAGVAPACACGGGAQPQALEPSSEDLQLVPLIAGLEPNGLPAVSAAARSTRAAGPALPGLGVAPSEAHHRSCGASRTHPYVFSLGTLGYDFGCEARLDYFVQQVGTLGNAFNPVKMAEHLDEKKGGHPEDANALIWTLNIDATPIYAIEPEDQFAVISFVLLTRFLVEQELEGVERISIAGHVTGRRRLYNGTVVPVIAPVTRGMFNWSADAMVQSILGPAKDDAEYKSKADGIRQFLHRIYYELRNLGTAPQERAMNFAATNAFQLKEVYEDAYKENLQLDTIDVERSPICRPESDCWDVKLKFFDPAKRLERARKLYRYTVDVSDIVPVTVGTLRTWFIY